MHATRQALDGLHQTLHAPTPTGVALGNWRWHVRQRLVALREALVLEAPGTADGWTVARGGALIRERNELVTRLAGLMPQVLEADVEIVRELVQRLIADVRHHSQRLYDLAYDEVEMEIGGSE